MITRASGTVLVVMVLATVSVGILLAVRRGGAQVRGQARLHRRLSWIVLALLAVHVGAALLDRHHVPPYALVAPFVSHTRRIAAGTGSLAIWGVVIVTLSAAGRRWLRPSWRKIHYLAYPACALAVWHSLLGSDAHLIAFWLGLWSGAVLLSLVPKVRGALTTRRKPVSSLVSNDVPAVPTAAWEGPGVGPGSALPPDNGRGAAARAANHSLDDALARVRAYQDLLQDLRSSTPVADPAVGSPVASEIARQLLLDRGLTVPPDVARRTADHLLAPSRWGDERSAEFRFRPSAGEEVSVVITSTDLRTAIEAARLRLPRTPLPLAGVGTA